VNESISIQSPYFAHTDGTAECWIRRINDTDPLQVYLSGTGAFAITAIRNDGAATGNVHVAATFDGTNYQYGTFKEIEVGVWYHSATTIDDSTGNLILYIDGEIVLDITMGTNLRAGTLRQIGAFRTRTNHFGGDMAVTRLYNRILTQEEVRSNYNAESMRFA